MNVSYDFNNYFLLLKRDRSVSGYVINFIVFVSALLYFCFKFIGSNVYKIWPTVTKFEHFLKVHINTLSFKISYHISYSLFTGTCKNYNIVVYSASKRVVWQQWIWKGVWITVKDCHKIIFYVKLLLLKCTKWRAIILHQYKTSTADRCSTVSSL